MTLPEATPGGRLLVVLVDGWDEDFLGESSAFKASRLATATRSAIRLPAGCRGRLAWASLLSGTLPHENRYLGPQPALPDGLGVATPTPMLLHQTVLAAADSAGRSTALANLPRGWGGCSEDAQEIGQEFLETGDADALRAVQADAARSLLASPASVTEAHLDQLSPTLSALPETDRRRQLCAGLLARALSQHNAATALVAEHPDLSVVRYDWLAMLFGLFIDYEQPAPYLPEAEVPVFRQVLRSAVDLQGMFADRLRELADADVVVTASDHGWRRRPLGQRGREGHENFDLADPRFDIERAMLTPAHSDEYYRHGAWARIDHGAGGIDAPAESCSVAELAEWLADATGCRFGEARRSQQAELTAAMVAEEKPADRARRFWDDAVELGFVSPGDQEDAEREHAARSRDCLLAASHMEAGDWGAAIGAWQSAIDRTYSFGVDVPLLQCRLNLGDWRGACAHAQALARLAPKNKDVMRAWFAASHQLGRREDAGKALVMLSGVDPTLAEKLAATNGYTMRQPPASGARRDDSYVLAVSNDLDWWKRIDAQLAEDSRLAIDSLEALARLDLEPIERFCDRHFESSEAQFDLATRFRSRGLASARRHADPTQAQGLIEAQRLEAGDGAAGTVLEEACSLHRLLFAGMPEVTAKLRNADSRVVVTNAWLDGSPAPTRTFIDGDPAARMAELDAGLKRLEGELSPLLLSAALLFDFFWIHPFLDGNGRTGRLLSGRLLTRLGVPRVPMLNIERRLDRRRALYEATLNLAWTTRRPDWFLHFWVKFLSQSAQDALHRAKRLQAYAASRRG